MSYARFEKDVSDVYVFHHYQGGIECCGCQLLHSVVNLRPLQMLRHLKAHRDAGHLVPTYTFYGVFRDRHDLTRREESGP